MKDKDRRTKIASILFVTHEFNCLFWFEESAYVNYARLCLRKIRVKNIFSPNTNTLTERKHEKSPPSEIHTSQPHRRKLNICLFSPSLLKNLASLSNFSLYFFCFFFLGQVWDSLRRSRIQFTAVFFHCFEPSWCLETEGRIQTAAEAAYGVSGPDGGSCSLDPCAELPVA